MRVLYLTIDNINDPVILAQTFPFLGRLAALPGVDGIDLFALRKDGGERYRAYLPAGVFRVRIGKNHGIWHPLSLLTLLRFALRAWSLSRAGTLLIGRNPVSLLCLFPAALRRGTRLVLDYRGLLSEEYVLQGKITRRGWWHRLLRGLEAWALQRADVILCVSDRLRRRSIRWRPTIAERLRVVPCCYDPRMVRRDETAIERLRVELNAAADFLLAYAGSLSAWNRPEAILAVFRAFRAIRPDARLLLLTHDLAKAQVIFGAEAGVLVRRVPHETIQDYLALADLGLLVRDRCSVNRVASPVKFAEYLACGLPVLVSPGIGDCPDIVRRERVGYVLDASLQLPRIVSEIAADRAGLRNRCREVAARLFDGDRYLPLYNELLGGTAARHIPEPSRVGKACM